MDGISISASVVTLAALAFQASKSLYQAVESFKSSKRTIRELRLELGGLLQALDALKEAATDNEAELAALKLPLARCSKICKEFEVVINRCVSRSGGDRTSFRDWAKLQYAGGDIENLRIILGGYKSTISIVLGGATFRRVAVTASVLNEYQQMIADTTSDLRDHLEVMDEKLEALQSGSNHAPNANTNLLEEIREEKESTEQCLKACGQVSECIDKVQQQLLPHDSPSRPVNNSRQAHKYTERILTDFKGRLTTNSAELKDRLKELDNRFHAITNHGAEMSDEDAAELKLIQEQKESLTQCLEICTGANDTVEKARINVFEDVVSGDNSYQLVVSTIGDLMAGKHIITGSDSVQGLGQMSDDTVQQLIHGRSDRAREKEKTAASNDENEFKDRWGTGYKLQRQRSKVKRSPSSETS
ncbi:hypothetical protein AJ80_03341 [Polytolypa hystricis UAMH7299]|uniref:Azaphilone pigments biosynthesis cluster protein L N-terminal domain-containing protein n=1 Tax=Polytolypa hystricis (strain UAMH7299) TaxID=1447883 RepID=A0A2B7YJQ0_POLH7|nr:hypothetical protein AJ80_03341 [Polytolypa hystricis UAMH7299]